MLKIDTKNPIHLSIITLIITFSISILVIYISKPKWIQIQDPQMNKKISYKLLFSFSLLFALVVAIGTLLFIPQQIQYIYSPNNL